VTEILLSLEKTDDVLTILYEDNGVGITPEFKEKIFIRGFGKHTGLGLFLIREILSITGITIAETGEYGKGVRFAIRVPNDRYRLSVPSSDVQ
jgi:signal transduction histidine kinase